MLITEEQIQRLAETADIQLVAQSLGIPATVVARDILETKLEASFYLPVKCAGASVKAIGRIPVWVVMWQCQEIPSRGAGFSYIQDGIGLN